AGGGGGAVSDGGDRSSGARGWEDRSYGGASADASSHDAGRTRRRRGGAAPEGEGGDSYSGYGGAEG
ncbi:MAG TPA: RNA-binding protein, partial [Prochlorococcus sp.]